MDSGSIIRDIIDRNLQKWRDLGLDSVPVEPPPSMAASETSDEDGYWRWTAIPSTVTDEELASLEATIGLRLPPSYKVFLQHKHFYDLNMYDARFFNHVAGSWQHELLQWCKEGVREDIIDQGYLPFADWAGAGDLLCFDTNRAVDTHEYPVVEWNHEDSSTTDLSANFTSLLLELDAQERQLKRGA